MTNLASAGTNAETIRVFLIFIVIFSLPTSILSLHNLLNKLERHPEKAPAPPMSCPGSCPSIFYRSAMTIGNIGAFVAWIFGQIFYFRCLPTTCNQYTYEWLALDWIISGYVHIFVMVMSDIAIKCDRKKKYDLWVLTGKFPMWKVLIVVWEDDLSCMWSSTFRRFIPAIYVGFCITREIIYPWIKFILKLT